MIFYMLQSKKFNFMFTLSKLCCSTSSVSLFLEINITQTEVSVTFTVVLLQIFENHMFSIEMDASNFI